MKIITPQELETLFSDIQSYQDIYLYHINDDSKPLLEEFIKAHPPYDHTTDIEYEESDHIYGFPIVTITMPTHPTQSKFYDAFLDNILKIPLLRGETKKKQYLIRYYLKILKVELLIIENIDTIFDEVIFIKHNILSSIKHLQISLNIPIVLTSKSIDVIDILRGMHIEE